MQRSVHNVHKLCTALFVALLRHDVTEYATHAKHSWHWFGEAVWKWTQAFEKFSKGYFLLHNSLVFLGIRGFYFATKLTWCTQQAIAAALDYVSYWATLVLANIVLCMPTKDMVTHITCLQPFVKRLSTTWVKRCYLSLFGKYNW